MYIEKTHIHFAGIGGIGMSGIATILRNQGYTISGCDLDTQQVNAKNLTALCRTVYQGNNTPNCITSDVDVLVYSSAISTDHPEIAAARALGIPTIPRALMLAELMRTKYSVAIAGSHGKTTTTSIISHLLIEAGWDPTVIIGGHLKSISTNARIGDGKFLIAEADESDRSLLHLHATIALVTNIDLEHLETYQDLADIKETFLKFLENLPFYGSAILCLDDPHVQTLLPLERVKSITYGEHPAATYRAHSITLNPENATFIVEHAGHKLGTVCSRMPGIHNVRNTLGAITLAHTLGIPFPVIQKSLETFRGVERRFSYHGIYKGAEIFDDYGHHPTEISYTLTAARHRARGRLVVLFQPQRFSRTKHLWREFIEAFVESYIDHLIITDIYPANEAPIPGITAEQMIRELRKRNPHRSIQYIPYDPSCSTIIDHLNNTLQKDDLLLLLGAGKVHTIAQRLLAPSQDTQPNVRPISPKPTITQ